jgi:hypothetical protein
MSPQFNDRLHAHLVPTSRRKVGCDARYPVHGDALSLTQSENASATGGGQRFVSFFFFLSQVGNSRQDTLRHACAISNL